MAAILNLILPFDDVIGVGDDDDAEAMNVETTESEKVDEVV